MRGRKPVPTALKVLRGNPGRRPINKSEPSPPSLALECPPELNEAAKAEWQRVAKDLIEPGQVTTVDRGTFMAYCVKYAQWMELEREAALHPNIVRSPSGYPMPNPATGMANKAMALMLKAAAELGITPSSRSRVHVREQSEKDANPLARFLKKA